MMIHPYYLYQVPQLDVDEGENRINRTPSFQTSEWECRNRFILLEIIPGVDTAELGDFNLDDRTGTAQYSWRNRRYNCN